MLEDRLRNQDDLEKLKLQFEKMWCYSTETSARYSSESEKTTETKNRASGMGAVQLKDWV